MKVGTIACICGETADVLENARGKVFPKCPNCSKEYQSNFGQRVLREKMTPLKSEIEPEVIPKTESSPEPETTDPGSEESSEKPEPKPAKKKFSLFNGRGAA